MGGRIRPMGSHEAESILRRHGFHLVSQHGSHRKWRHPDRRLQVIVPAHAGRNLPTGTLRTILSTAEIPESEWQT